MPCSFLEGWHGCCFRVWIFGFLLACFIDFSKFGETLVESHGFHCILPQQQLIFLWRCPLTQHKYLAVIYIETWNTPERIRNGQIKDTFKSGCSVPLQRISAKIVIKTGKFNIPTQEISTKSWQKIKVVRCKNSKFIHWYLFFFSFILKHINKVWDSLADSLFLKT